MAIALISMRQRGSVAKSNHLHGRRCGLGVAEILRPNAIKRVLLGEIGDEPVRRDHIAEISADSIETAP